MDAPVQQEEAAVDAPVQQEEAAVDAPAQQEEAEVEVPAQQEEAAVEAPVHQEEAAVEAAVEQEEAAVEAPAQQEEAALEAPVQQQEEAVVEAPAQQEEAVVEAPAQQEQDSISIVVDEGSLAFSSLGADASDMLLPKDVANRLDVPQSCSEAELKAAMCRFGEEALARASVTFLKALCLRTGVRYVAPKKRTTELLFAWAEEGTGA